MGEGYARLARAALNARGARRDALLTVLECLKASDPRAMVRRALSYDGRTLRAGEVELDTRDHRRILVIGGGKASAMMAEETWAVLGSRVTAGRVIVPSAQRNLPRLSRIQFRGSSHPFPSKRGVRAVEWMLDLVGRLRADDLVICLVSGGGSALMPLPMKGVSVEQKQGVTALLLRSGASIDEINCVRRHLSALKGGRLAEMLRPARVLSLIVSDVVGDNLASVASGPTVPDPTSYAQAKRVLVKYGVWRRSPAQVRALVESGLRGRVPETPKPGSPVFARVDNVLVGSNRIPLDAARRTLSRKGYATTVLPAAEGEARLFGRRLARFAVAASAKAGRSALVAGGETTVEVSGSGVGGRNQEVALAAAMGIAGKKRILVASFGTDGVDGPTDAAGAVADCDTVRRGRELGMVAGRYLEDNDSHSYFARLGDLILTGPTGTNVNDVMLALIGER